MCFYLSVCSCVWIGVVVYFWCLWMFLGVSMYEEYKVKMVYICIVCEFGRGFG